jgi:16S rRNA (guanine1207-N2)-methyltransferase
MPQYFDEEPNTRSAPERVEVDLGDVSFAMSTDHGVFSHGRLDRGTRLLLTRAPAPGDHGNLLDLGCGAGPIAITLALRSPSAVVWAVDVNERARELCTANASSLGLDNVKVLHPDDLDPTIRFDAIWSNPPIRIGKPALHAMLERWLARLNSEASAWLVVQRHLGADSLERWITDLGYRTERRASRSSYRLLEVSRDIEHPAATPDETPPSSPSAPA